VVVVVVVVLLSLSLQRVSAFIIKERRKNTKHTLTHASEQKGREKKKKKKKKKPSSDACKRSDAREQTRVFSTEKTMKMTKMEKTITIKLIVIIIVKSDR